MARKSGGLVPVLAAAVLAAAFYLTAPAYDHHWRWTPPDVAANPAANASAPIFEEHLIDPAGGGFQHAAAFVRMDGQLVAFWYSGDYEGAVNSQIKSSRFDGRAWSPPTVVTDQVSTARDLGRFIKTLGNAVPFVSDDGALHLFYTVVPMRGWSTASIAVKTTRDGGRTWMPARRLISSPLLNLSTMVKSVPITAPDGSILLPGYWSLGTQYPLLLRVSRDLRVTGIRRMGDYTAGLQPTIMPVDDQRAMAFLRALRHARGVGLTTTTTADGGRTWTAPRQTGLPNDGTPTVGLKFAKNTILTIFSESKEEILSFAIFGDDGQLRERLFSLPTRFKGNKAYPYALRGDGGLIDLMFSCNDNTAICHARFNDAWLAEQRRVAGGVH